MKAAPFAALGAVLLLAATDIVSAQPPAGQRQDRATARDGRDGRDGRQRDGRAARQRAGRDGAGRALLRGVQLTETQRTQLSAINQKFAQERQALVQQVRGAAGAPAAGERRTRPDSATRAQLRTRVQSLADRHRTELRAILTPEQQRTFDANVTQLRERGAARQGKGAERRRG